jgi:hypothetical protein
VGGVRHELPLARQRSLGLPAGGAQLAEHVLEGIREVGDLVVRVRLRQHDVRVASAGHLASGAREPGDWPHRSLRHQQAAEEGQERAAQDAEPEEEPDAVHGVLDAALRLRVLDVADRPSDRPREVEGRRRAGLPGHHELAGRHAKVADVRDPPDADRWTQVHTGVTRPDRAVGRIDDADDRIAGGEAAQRVRVGLAQLDAAVGCLLKCDAVLEVARVRAQLVVEPADDAALRHGAHHHGKQAEDRERERRAQHRHLQLHGEAGPHGSLNT